jgi:hypothetical protein
MQHQFQINIFYHSWMNFYQKWMTQTIGECKSLKDLSVQ